MKNSFQPFKKAPFHRKFRLKAHLNAKVHNWGFCFDSISTCNKGSVLAKRSLLFIQSEPLFHQDRASVLFSPRAIHFRPRAEYIDLPASLKALNALPPDYNTLQLGMSFFTFSRYLLIARRLQTKLKRLKPDNSVKIQ